MQQLRQRGLPIILRQLTRGTQPHIAQVQAPLSLSYLQYISNNSSRAYSTPAEPTASSSNGPTFAAQGLADSDATASAGSTLEDAANMFIGKGGLLAGSQDVDVSNASNTTDAIMQILQQAEVTSRWEASNDVMFATQFMQEFLCFIHDATGLPWWVTIMMSTVLLRMTSFPLFVIQTKSEARRAMAQPQIMLLEAEAKVAKLRGSTDLQINKAKRMGDIMQAYKFNPLYSMLPPLINAPIFLSMFWAINTLVEAKVPSLTVGGPSLFMDLTQPDPSCLLPALNVASILLISYLKPVSGMENEKQKNLLQSYMPYIRIGTLFLLPVLWNMKAAVFLYIIPTMLYTGLSRKVMEQAPVRQTFGIPTIKSLQHDVRYIEGKLSQRQNEQDLNINKLLGKKITYFDYNPASTKPVREKGVVSDVRG